MAKARLHTAVLPYAAGGGGENERKLYMKAKWLGGWRAGEISNHY